MVRCRSDDGAHVGRAGAPSHPGLAFHFLAQGPELSGDVGGLTGLAVVGRRVGQGQFHAGGQAHAVVHLGQHEARVPVADREGRSRVRVVDAEMQVVAALWTQRQPVAEAFGQGARVGAQCQHDVAGMQFGAVRQRQAPALLGLLQRHGIGVDELAAARAEEPRVAFHQPHGRLHGPGVLPVDAAGDAAFRAQAGQAGAQGVVGQHLDVQAPAVSVVLRLARKLDKGLLAAHQLDPAAVADDVVQVGGTDEWLVLGHAQLDERAHVLGGLRQPGGGGFPPVAPQPAGVPRQCPPLQA